MEHVFFHTFRLEKLSPPVWVTLLHKDIEGDPKDVHRSPLTPSLPQPVKFPGWKMHVRASKQYIFRSYKIWFQCYALWWKSFHMPVRKRRQKQLRVLNFALLLVVLKWRHGSEVVNGRRVFDRDENTKTVKFVSVMLFLNDIDTGVRFQSVRIQLTSRNEIWVFFAEYRKWCISSVVFTDCRKRNWLPSFYNRKRCFLVSISNKSNGPWCLSLSDKELNSLFFLMGLLV